MRALTMNRSSICQLTSMPIELPHLHSRSRPAGRFSQRDRLLHPQTRAYAVQLNAPSLSLQKLQIVQAKNLGISGTLTMSASGAGTMENPQLTAALEVPQLQFRNKSISQIKGQLHVANERAELTFDSQVAQASMHSKVDINLSDDYYTEASSTRPGCRSLHFLQCICPVCPRVFRARPNFMQL